MIDMFMPPLQHDSRQVDNAGTISVLLNFLTFEPG